MTEIEWQASLRALPMLLFLREQASERKVLLFNCACCRRIWARLDQADRDAVEQAEASADDPAAIQELRLQLEPERMANLALAGVPVGYQHPPVNESLARKLTEQTTIRLGLDCHRGWGIGILAHKAAELASMAVPEMERSAALALEDKAQAELVREIIGNPFCPVAVDPAWLTRSVLDLAQASYHEQAHVHPILADALEDAGCGNDVILKHLREPGPHARGCWALDLVLGKE